MIAPHVIGPMHTKESGRAFTIGQIDPAKGYLHVFDDTSLEIVMRTLDTITDFVTYLAKKERFIQSGRLFWAAGEEDLLAYYLKDINYEGEHDFIFPNNIDAVSIDEGFWLDFVNNRQRAAQIQANRISSLWDMLIERFSTHVLRGTQYYTTHPGAAHAERILRFMARESRTRRRILAQSLMTILQTTPPSMKRTRVILPSNPGDPYYVFLLLPQLGFPDDEYRIVRYRFLESYCRVAKRSYPEAQDIIGIATETGLVTSEHRSEDAMYLDARQWTSEDQADAEQLQRDLGLLTNTIKLSGVEQEYPSVSGVRSRETTKQTASAMKGRDRNKSCSLREWEKVQKMLWTIMAQTD